MVTEVPTPTELLGHLRSSVVGQSLNSPCDVDILVIGLILRTHDETCRDVQLLCLLEINVSLDGERRADTSDISRFHRFAVERNLRSVLGSEANVLVEGHRDSLLAKEQETCFIWCYAD